MSWKTPNQDLFSGPGLSRAGGFHSVGELALAIVIVVGLVPLSLYYLFYDLSNPLLDPHPWRQAQTALTVRSFFEEGIGFWKYPTTMNGELWNFTREFPIYQVAVAIFMYLGQSLEVAARTVSILSFAAATYFLSRLVSLFFGPRTGVWAGLLYLTLPFCTIFARACLIDFMVQAFTLAFLFHAARYLTPRVTGGGFPVAVLVYGLLAAVAKVPFWMLASFFIGLWILVDCLIRHEVRPRERNVLIALFIQCVAGLLWAKHAQNTYSANISVEEASWLFGPMEIRFDLAHWTKLAGSLSRSVLNTWLVVPLAAALFIPGPYRRFFWVFVAGCFFSVLVWFRIHAAHDYYFLIELPFLIAIAAYGLVRIFEVGRFHRAWYGVMLVAFLWSLKGLPYRYETISFDYRKWLGPYQEVAQLIEADEIVLSDHLDLMVPIYANRYVAWSDVKFSGGVSPWVAERISAYRFEPGRTDFGVLAGKKTLGLAWDSKGVAYFRVDPFLRHSTRLVLWNDDADLKPNERAALACRIALPAGAAPWEVITSTGHRVALPPYKHLGATPNGAAECALKVSRLPSFQTRN